jgi:hypothetical protein
MKKVLFSLSAILALFLSACTKEEDDVDIDVSKHVYLYDSYWMLTSVLHNNDYTNENSPTIDITSTFNQCELDNVYYFEPGGHLNFNESFMKCNANDPEERNYYYSISNGDSYFKSWTNAEDPDHSIFVEGKIITYNTKHFVVETMIYDPSTEKTEFFSRTYKATLQKTKQ